LGSWPGSAQAGIIRRGFRLFAIVIRYNGFRSRKFTAINVQLDAGRKGFLGWSIDVERDWANFRFDGRRHGFATINVQLDAGRKGFLGWSIDVERVWASFRFDGRRHGFAAINVQLDAGRKGFLVWSIDVGRDRRLPRRRGKARESIVCESVV
jgi:hypothetical protein